MKRGHGIHHMLTQIDAPAVSGDQRCSMGMRSSCRVSFSKTGAGEEEALAFISGHHESGEALPKEMLDKMLDAKNFHSAMGILRQLEFGLFDFTLYSNYDPEIGAQVLDTLFDIKSRVSVVPSPEWGPFPSQFQPHFCRWLQCGLLQLPMGRGAIVRCLFAV